MINTQYAIFSFSFFQCTFPEKERLDGIYQLASSHTRIFVRCTSMHHPFAISFLYATCQHLYFEKYGIGANIACT